MHVPKVLGLWLLYAVSGLVLAVAAAGMSSDLQIDDGDTSPTRGRTKVLGGVSGLLLALGGIGRFLLHDPAAGAPDLARTLFAVGVSAGSLAAVGSWWMISRDLRRVRG